MGALLEAATAICQTPLFFAVTIATLGFQPATVLRLAAILCEGRDIFQFISESP